MNKVAIVTDSASTIPEEIALRYGIHIVPLLIHLEGKTYVDTVDIKTASELFKLINSSKNFPTTSAPTPGEYTEIYHKLSSVVDSILTITISSNVSMCFKSACQARDIIRSEKPSIDIEIFDSRITVGAMGLIVIGAARAAADGLEMKEVIAVAEDIRSKVNMLFMMDTLEYLARSGRISRAKAMAGNMLSMKPITEFSTSTGKPNVAAKPRTRKKAIRTLLDMVESRVDGHRPLRVMVEHTCVLEEAKQLKQTVLDRFKCTEVLLSEYTPVASVIAGPRVLGLDFYQE
jgi:DegV family protein with EDD domain